jgi:nitrous oxide reductase accessory protein NosL
MLKTMTITIALLCSITLGQAFAAPAVKPSPKDKCPVCGMFVAKYPDFTTHLQFRDGTVVFFDGSKDLFKYLLDMKKYAPGRTASDISRIMVDDYYSLAPIDARSAWFVAGSDVYGPMGKELIAFGKEADAKEFNRDHRGKKILRFKDVTPAILAELD